jgi:hypothetical protein
MTDEIIQAQSLKQEINRTLFEINHKGRNEADELINKV